MPQLLLNCQGSLGLHPPTKPVNVSQFGTGDPVQLQYQILAIRSFLRHARARKSRLDEKIASLEATLNDLYSERDALDKEIRNHTAALSPIRRMPNEILSLVFSLVLANDAELHYLVDSAPWTLSAVCARWRSVALSPIFWTKISNWERRFSLEKLAIFLSRSGSSPLRIYFYSDNEELMSEIETTTLELLLQHCERWELLSINGSTEIYSIVESFGPRFSMLRTLEFDVYYTNERPAPYELSVFSHAPKLETVSVNVGCWPYPIILDLPWHQLSRYYASSEWNGLFSLASAVNLVECSLDLGDGLEPAVKDVVVMQFPRLLRLSVSHRGILAYLDTPVLQELYYHDSDRAKSVDDFEFFRALPRTLQTLVFEAYIDTDKDFDLMDIMKALPQMRSFTLSTAFSADSVCAFLASAAKRFPLLENLSLALPENSELHILDILEALDWADDDRRLRTFRFLLDNVPPTSLILPRLKSLKVRGARIEFEPSQWRFYTSTVPRRFRFER
ncbi:hypothetical protein FB45DRAFT_69661 [Roridomyces roridus]|uniref:F-box domain-containing protein n=1 Tax=Roridomyces roridus TaxID=1738132 RepID=A0AAD7BML7_9AGAR|nr:hypothetical protein FB45DRAFT_69661 [Roridomyces roridus]